MLYQKRGAGDGRGVIATLGWLRQIHFEFQASHGEMLSRKKRGREKGRRWWQPPGISGEETECLCEFPSEPPPANISKHLCCVCIEKGMWAHMRTQPRFQSWRLAVSDRAQCSPQDGACLTHPLYEAALSCGMSLNLSGLPLACLDTDKIMPLCLIRDSWTNSGV